MNIIRLNLSHADRMSELEKLCFPVPWSRGMVRDELTNDIGYYVGAEEDGLLVGYAGMQIIIDEGYITNVAVDPGYRRRGIADALLRALRSRADERALSFMTLEVRRSNLAAQRLYEKHGFSAAGVRKNYYRKPTEDAIIMTLNI